MQGSGTSAKVGGARTISSSFISVHHPNVKLCQNWRGDCSPDPPVPGPLHCSFKTIHLLALMITHSDVETPPKAGKGRGGGGRRSLILSTISFFLDLGSTRIRESFVFQRWDYPTFRKVVKYVRIVCQNVENVLLYLT